jgi:hypothetical protein
VRLAVALRMRARLLNIAGRALLTGPELDGDTRRSLQALLGCEAFAPGGSPDPTKPADVPTLPPLAEEVEQINTLRPSYLGVKYRPANKVRVKGRALPEGTVEIQEVLPDTPASRAGLRVGDLVLGSHGRDFVGDNAIRHFVMMSKKGRPIPLRIMRGGRQMRRPIKLVAWPMKPIGIAASSRVGEPSPPISSLRFVGSPADLAGRKHVLFYWHPDCRECLDGLRRLDAQFEGTGVAIVAIADVGEGRLRSSLDGPTRSARVHFAADPSRSSFKVHGINGTPTLVAVDEAGVIRHRQVGVDDSFDIYKAFS